MVEKEQGEEKRSHVPAYVSCSTFISFISGFSEDAGIPDHIDKSLMPKMSGAVQGHLMSSLKFLNLIEDDGRVTAKMRDLVAHHNTDEWQKSLKKVLESAYQPIVGNTDVTRSTPKQLRDKFKEAGATGGTTAKAIRFYLNTLKETGVDVPKHLSKVGDGSSGASTRVGTNGRKKTEETMVQEAARPIKKPKIPEGSESLPVPLGEGRHGTVYYPADLTEEECEKFEAAIEYLRVLVR